MAVQGDVMAAVEPTGGETRPRRAALSPELIAILAVGVALAGVMLTMTMVIVDAFAREMGAIREDVREIRAGQIEVRDRLSRVEAGQGELRDRLARVEAGQAELQAGQAELRAGQDELRDRLARVEAGQAELQAGQDELRDRMARVESKVDVLTKDEPPERSAGGVE